MHSGFEHQFSYNKDQVRIEGNQEGELHVIDVYIEDRLVNRKLFFSLQEADIHHFNLKLAIQLGAQFNAEGYWAFDNYPLQEKTSLQEEYYRLAKG